MQLEILRRAGAMPVSSRRCGMITRREAERLCKSFLGDNAPPRLPEDFAFSVHHECAWGCRGSFLPSRYNSSRAKCIKCSYCGLFFSPNKFIFHSHRVGPGDKYIQPDAANFNSWRRHMKLSGGPPEEITHAWEDVKAMFNGGTRKRLMSSSASSASVTTAASSPHHHSHHQLHHHHHHHHGGGGGGSLQLPSPKRFKESRQRSSSPAPLIQAAVAAAAAVAGTQFPLRPPAAGTPANISTTTPSSVTAKQLPSELQMPFSRTFMMDYMWHAQNKQNSHFQFPTYALPWLKRPDAILFNHQSNIPAAAVAAAAAAAATTATESDRNDTPTKPMQFYNNSAFKPVMNAHHHNLHQSVAHRGISSTPPPPPPPPHLHQHAAQRHLPAPPPSFSSDDDHRSSSDLVTDEVKDIMSSDDEMVDIETTEECDVHRCSDDYKKVASAQRYAVCDADVTAKSGSCSVASTDDGGAGSVNSVIVDVIKNRRCSGAADCSSSSIGASDWTNDIRPMKKEVSSVFCLQFKR